MLTISVRVSNEDSIDATQTVFGEPFDGSCLEALANVYDDSAANTNDVSESRYRETYVPCPKRINEGLGRKRS